MIFNFCANGAFAVYLVYAVRSLGLSPAAIGVIFSLGNVGWLAGCTRRRQVVGASWASGGDHRLRRRGRSGLMLVPLAPRPLRFRS